VRTSLLVVALLQATCGGTPARSTSPAPEAIVASWRDLEPRLRAVYRGRIDLESGTACASELQIVVPSRGPAPSRLCTPLADVVAWHSGHAVALPAGPSLWIATTRSLDAVERVAAAVAAPPDATAFDTAVGEALATQFRCGQLALRWRIPAAHQSCQTAADCRTFTGPCFAATVSVHDAAPYEELHRRWGGTCVDPSGGVCPPAGAAACVEGRCTIAVP
jgi:hypothetical protein